MHTLQDLAETILSIAETADKTWKPGGPPMSALINQATDDMWAPDGYLVSILLSGAVWNNALDWADRYMNVPYPITPYTNWDMTDEQVIP